LNRSAGVRIASIFPSIWQYRWRYFILLAVLLAVFGCICLRVGGIVLRVGGIVGGIFWGGAQRSGSLAVSDFHSSLSADQSFELFAILGEHESDIPKIKGWGSGLP